MKYILLLILRKFLGYQISSLQNGRRIFQSLMVVLFLLLNTFASFLKFASNLNVIHKDILIRLFVYSLEDEESHQVHEEEQEQPHESIEEDEFDEDLDVESIQASISPPHEDKGLVSCTPFQVFEFYDASFDDLESEEFLEKPLDLVNFSFDEEHDGHEIENIDDLLHIERHKWDISCFHFDGDPIYDIDDDSRVKIAELLPLEQPSLANAFSENCMINF
jgi:hypothetical protein